MKKTFKEFLSESSLKDRKKILNLFENGEMNFGQFRDMINGLFGQEISYVQSLRPMYSVSFTCRNGAPVGVLESEDHGKPLASKALISSMRCNKEMKEAMTNTLKLIEDKLSKVNHKLMEDLFEDGHRFVNFDIMPVKSLSWLELHGNRFPVFYLGSKRFSKNFNSELTINEDEEDPFEENVARLFMPSNANMIHEEDGLVHPELNECGDQDPLCHKDYALDPEIVDYFKVPSCKKCRDELMAQLATVTDGLGYRSTLNDYIKDRYERKIMNAAMKSDLDIRRSSDFVSELVNRFSVLSNKRPTLSDLTTYAKREGINVNSENYKNFLEYLGTQIDTDNNELLKPIVDMFTKILISYLNAMRGYVALNDRNLCRDMTHMCSELESGCSCCEAGTVKNLKKLFDSIAEFEVNHPNVDEYAFVSNDKPYCLYCACPRTDLIREKALCC